MHKTCVSSVAFSPALRGMVLCVCTLVSPVLLAQVTASAAKPSQKIAPNRAKLKTPPQPKLVNVRAAEATLSLDQLSIAEWVEVGVVPCELGQSVSVVADPLLPGYFDVQVKKSRFRMVPMVSSTGAIRLEDAAAGAVWLQLANKSMLMSQKLGSRLADACVSPAQALFAAAMEKSPPPSLLDSPMAVELPDASQAAAATVPTEPTVQSGI